MEKTFIQACNSGDLEAVKTLMPQGVDGQDIINWAVQLASSILYPKELMLAVMIIMLFNGLQKMGILK